MADSLAVATMSSSASSAAPSAPGALDRAVEELRAHAAELARLAPAAKAALVRQCIPRLVDAAPAWAAAGAKAKGLGGDVSEDWLSGPLPVVRMARLLAASLDAIAARGRPPLGARSQRRSDGRLAIDLFPGTALDRVLFSGFRGYVLMQEGVDRDAAVRQQATFYQEREPEGGVSLILGAGNVSSIPPMDVLSKMFIEGYVCLLKMNPVNEWAGPFMERALEPLIKPGFLRVVYGGADVGQYLVYHAGIDDVHITGSDKTHDMIVWGPPGPERDRRMAADEPLLNKPISSELGNVSPVAIVPYAYSQDELAFQARNVATMVANNASFNCNAAKMLITSKEWPQRDQFLQLVGACLDRFPTRRAYYPGAFDRYDALVGGRPRVERHGQPGPGEADADKGGGPRRLPWTMIRDVDAGARTDPLFHTEPFCAILSETSLGTADPIEFLDSATRFMNDTLWGTLNACIVIHPKHEQDTTVGRALDRAIVDLRYGTVGINHWPALGYALGALPWGGHPSATLKNIQSGLGWVHNTFMLGGVDKSVVHGPLRVRPTPVWFYDNRKATALGPKLLDMEASPSWWKLPGVLMRAL
ncbi:MAG TPA: aldehyde dehydrogenase family protein [Kofleriaceae bacterium]|nr:aldehyde dehydrogenase family protein [Kofleriaceae bacterium]